MVDIGRDPASGKRRQKTRGGFRTRSEAERTLREFIGRLESGDHVADTSLTLAEYLDQWLTTAKPNLRPTTFGGYGRDVANICSKLGAVRLIELTPIEHENLHHNRSVA